MKANKVFEHDAALRLRWRLSHHGEFGEHAGT
jgi:hypothetical protein